MGKFTSAITNSGRILLADVQAGAVLIPTNIVIGSGNMPAGKTPATMTNVAEPIKELAINTKKKTPDGKCIVGGVYTNEDIRNDFYFRELALYARAEYRDSDGNVTQALPEVLYSYGNAGTTADLMPAYSTSTVVEKQIDVVIWVGNDAQVDLTIETGIYATKEELAAAAAGAVKKTGDTMRGTLNVAMDGGNAVIVSDDARAYLQTFRDGDWGNRRVLVLRNEQVATVSKMLAVGANVDGIWKEFDVLHTGNMEELLGIAPAALE